MREINDKNQFIMPHKKRDSFKEIQMRLKTNKKRLRILSSQTNRNCLISFLHMKIGAD